MKPGSRPDHMKGYMKGASAELELKTINAPSTSRTTTTGINHHFFSRLRNRRNSRKACHMGIVVFGFGVQPTRRR